MGDQPFGHGSIRPTRQHPEDGALVVKVDAGTPDTDPMLYDQSWSTSAQGAAPGPDFAAAGKHLQGATFQVKGAEIGDRIEVQFQSDGTVGPFGPDGTVLQTFGHINAPQADGAWSTYPVIFDTAKLVPSGIKVVAIYHVGATNPTVAREVLADWLCHE